MFAYMLTVNPIMALCILSPLILGILIQGVAMAVTGKQMEEYHRLHGKLNSAVMQFMNNTILFEILPFVKSISGDFDSTSLIGFDFTKRIIIKVFDKCRINGTVRAV